MQVGIRELKSRLSEFIRLAETGEPVIITDRGRVAAVLMPAPGRHQLEVGIREGWIQPASNRAPLAPIAGVRGQLSVAEVLGDDRGSR